MISSMLASFHKKLGLLGGLCLLLLIVLYLTYATKPGLSVSQQVIAQDYMVNAYVQKFDQEGVRTDMLQAATWSFFPEQGYSLLTEVMWHQWQQKTHWQLAAQRGRAYHTRLEAPLQQITLTDAVTLTRIVTATQPPLVVETQLLAYYPPTGELKTDQPVCLRQPGMTMTGTGLKGSLHEQHMSLLADVVTFYETPQLAAAPLRTQ